MKLAAVLDLSGAEAAFALGDVETGTVIVEEHKPMRGRESAGLLKWFKELVVNAGYSLDQIEEWTVGTGPGSFTGLRLVAAMVAGLTFDKKVRSRTLPTSFAMGFDSVIKNESAKRVATFHDGRQKEVLLFGMERADDTLVRSGDEAVLSGTEECMTLVNSFDVVTALSYERPAIEKALGVDVADSIVYYDHIPVSRMLFIESENWGEDLTDLVYIRPAVFVQPRDIRTV